MNPATDTHSFRRWAALLAALLLFAMVAVLPFLPALKPGASDCVLEVSLLADRDGFSQILWEGDFPTGDATVITTKSAEAVTLRFPLPPGAFRSLRFDPVSHPGNAAFGPARIVRRSGEVVRVFPVQSFRPANDAADVRITGDFLHFRSEVGDPYFVVDAHGLVLPKVGVAWDRQLGALGLAVAVVLGLAGLVGTCVISPLHGPRPWVRRACAKGGAHPLATLGVLAAVATVLSSYPLIFLGKSLVAPNFGTFWLYNQMPTVPGSTGTALVPRGGADVGAMAWSVMPFTSVERRSLQAGEWPLWNRYNSAGNPLLSQGQSMFGDPLQWLTLAANSASWAWDTRLVLAKFFFAFGVALCVWLLTGRLWPALALAVSAPFIGFFLYRVNHPAIFSLGYSPWILAGWFLIAKTPFSRRFARALAVWLLANWCVVLSGTVKEAYFLCLSLNAAGLLYFLFSALPPPERARKLAVLVVAAGALALLASPVWFNFLACLRVSGSAYENPFALQTPPFLALGFFDDIFYRSITPGEESFCPSANFFVLLGFLWWLASLRQSPAQPENRALGWLAAFAAAMVFGLVPMRLIVAVPFLGNVIHISNTFSCVLLVPTLVLAGVGWSHAFRWMTQGGSIAEASWPIGLFLALTGIFYGTAQAHSGMAGANGIPLSPFFIGYSTLLIVAVVIVGLVARWAFRTGWWTPAAWVLLLLCCGAFHWRMGLQVANVFGHYTIVPPARVDFHAPSAAIAWLQARQLQEDPFRVAGLDGNLTHGVPSFYGLEDISGPDALTNPAYDDLANACEAGKKSQWDWRINAALWRKNHYFYDLLNTRYFVAFDAVPSDSPLELVEHFDLYIYRSKTAWPRAFFTNQVASYDLAEELALLARESDGRPFAAVRRKAAAAWPRLLAAHPTTDRITTPASEYHLGPNATEFVVNADQPGLAVLTETDRPGDFLATLDGNPVDSFTVNHAFKGVRIDIPGQHRVRFTYEPRHWRATLVAAALGGLALALVFHALLAKRSLLRKYLAGPTRAPGNAPAA